VCHYRTACPQAEPCGWSIVGLMSTEHLPEDRYAPPSAAIHTDGLGVFSGSLGQGHHRFWFVPKERTSQSDLFDRVSGLLMREIKTALLVRALYLYPPGTTREEVPAMETFMLLLGAQPQAVFTDDEERDDVLSDEYDRLTTLCINELADSNLDHFPSLTAPPS
jgi:hypothetical protein